MTQTLIQKLDEADKLFESIEINLSKYHSYHPNHPERNKIEKIIYSEAQRYFHLTGIRFQYNLRREE